MVVMTETNLEQEDDTTEEFPIKPEKSGNNLNTTLYNFGYAPVEVIEKFQWFCFEHNTLADAIDSLLMRDKLLVTKYRFMNPPVLHQMLAKPTSVDSPAAVKRAMIALHKYTKEGRYKSVADAIEELLISPELSGFMTDMTNQESKEPYTMVTPSEEEALNKIADALFERVKSMAPTTGKKSTSKKRNSPNKNKTSEISGKSTTIALKQTKTVKVFDDDPDYNPESNESSIVWGGKRQLIKSLSLYKDNHGNGESSSKLSLLNAPDAKVNIPLLHFSSNYVKPNSKQSILSTLTKQKAGNDLQTDFLLSNLNLLPKHVFSLNQA